MLSQKVAVVALLLIPTFVEAQRKSKVRGDAEADWSKIDKSVQTNIKLGKGDVEKFSAIKLMVDKKKDLKLTDAQLKQLKDLDVKEECLNESRFKQVDSLKLAMRLRPGEDPDQESARTSLARQELMSVIRSIRSSYDSTYQEGLPLLDETQKKSVTELVEKERNEAEEDLRSKLGGRGGGKGKP